MINKVFNEDCLQGMKRIPNASVDMVLCDLPYGTTACKWDIVIPMDELWKHYERIVKPAGTIVLTSAQPFTSALVMSNPKMFKYNWVWDKCNATGHLNAKARPLKQHEDILVFSKGSATSTSLSMTYNPQGTKQCDITKTNYVTETTGERQSRAKGKQWKQSVTGYPKTIIIFPYDKQKLHPTQKPIALGEYLIRTYTNAGDVVLDNTCGVGSFPVAAVNTGRNFIGFETDVNYYNIAVDRIIKAQQGVAI